MIFITLLSIICFTTSTTTKKQPIGSDSGNDQPITIADSLVELRKVFDWISTVRPLNEAIRRQWAWISANNNALQANFDRAKKVSEIVRKLLDIYTPEKECLPPFGLSGIGECYFPASLETRVSWDKAREHCWNLGADLAAPTNVRDLQKFLDNNSVKGSYDYYYIGARIRRRNNSRHGLFYWIDGRLFEESHKSKYYETIPYFGDCVALLEASNYGLRSIDCTGKKRYVCQKKISN